MAIVYHGTAYGLTALLQQEGIRYLDEKNPFVYVTTKPNIAEEYAASWITGSIYNFDLKGHLYVEAGAVLEIDIDDSLLSIDDYDLIREPHQYKINGNIPASAIKSIKRIEDSEDHFVERILHVEADVFEQIQRHWVT